MATGQANIRNFISPLTGLGRTAPSLLDDLTLYDPRLPIEQGRNLLQDSPDHFVQSPQIVDLLPPGSCQHDFRIQPRQSQPPRLDERPTADSKYQVAACCQRCRTHILLECDYSIAWKQYPCPTSQNPLHHFVRCDWRQDSARRDARREGNEAEEIHVFECTSNTCSALLTLRLSPPILTDERVYILTDLTLLKQRTDAAFELFRDATEGMVRPTPIAVLTDLRTYIRTVWNSDISSVILDDNKRFITRFGPAGQGCEAVLQSLRFSHIDGGWQTPLVDKTEHLPLRRQQNVTIDNIEAELNALIATRPAEEGQQEHRTEVDSAATELARTLACQDYDRHHSFRGRTFDPAQRRPAYTILGVPQDASDELTVFAFERQVSTNNTFKQNAFCMTALEEIHRDRKSELLSQRVAMEQSLGRPSMTTVRDAYNSLGLQLKEEVTDDVIQGRFEARLQDAPGQGAAMRSALETVANYRNSSKLRDCARDSIETYDDALRFLDAGRDTDDAFIGTLFTTKVRDTPALAPLAQKCLKIIADNRKSDSLHAFIAADFQGEIPEARMDVAEAFQVLNVGDRGVDDETIWTAYTIYSSDPGANATKLRKALEVIAEEPERQGLRLKLGMPDPAGPQQRGIDLVNEPIGLDNIGNTCYLNSLLQWLFTITSVRRIVLNFEDYKRQADTDMTGKRVGQREISRNEIETAQRFIKQLAELFDQMITSPFRTYKPAQELARLTLETDGIKERRRASTLQSQRRPTLASATMQTVPTLASLPAPILDDEPEPMDVALPASPEQLKSYPALHIEEIPDSQRDIDQASEATLVSEPHTPQSRADGSDTTLDHGPLVTEKQDERSIIPSIEMMDIKSPKKEYSIASEGAPIQYAPPPGNPPPPSRPHESLLQYAPPPGPPPRPPPIPPRPGTTISTLENYARQQDVEEVLSHTLFQLSCAIRASSFDSKGNQHDEVYDTFYGENQEFFIQDNRVSPQPPQPFFAIFAPLFGKPKDIYSALDAAFDPDERGDKEAYTTITKLPPIVCINLGRVVFNERNQQVKLNYHVDIPQTLYMDRYLDVPEDDPLVERRKYTWNSKKQLRTIKTRLADLEPLNSEPVDLIMHNAANAMSGIQDIVDVDHDLIEQITNLSHTTREERGNLHERARNLEQQLSEAFTDSTFRKHEYILHAAFFHRGTVGSGHYWVYIYDHIAELWRKYNDDHITRVDDLNEIFGDPALHSRYGNGATPANAYVLVYVRSDQIATGQTPDIASIVETVKRDPIQLPDQPAAADLAHVAYARDNGYGGNGGDGTGQNLYPIGHDAPSQMSYMPPDHDRNFIGPMPAPGGVMSRPVQEDQDVADEEEDMRRAMEMSLMDTEPDLGRPVADVSAGDSNAKSVGHTSGPEQKRINTMDDDDVQRAAMAAHERYSQGTRGNWDDNETLARPGTW